MNNHPYVKVFCFVLLVILLFPLTSYKGKYIFRADELFGTGQAEVFQVGSSNLAVFRPDGEWHNHIWILYSKENDCRLFQIAGDRVTGVKNGYVPCGVNFDKWYNKGWIDFRGDSRRPFITKMIRE